MEDIFLGYKICVTSRGHEEISVHDGPQATPVAAYILKAEVSQKTRSTGHPDPAAFGREKDPDRVRAICNATRVCSLSPRFPDSPIFSVIVFTLNSQPYLQHYQIRLKQFAVPPL